MNVITMARPLSHKELNEEEKLHFDTDVYRFKQYAKCKGFEYSLINCSFTRSECKIEFVNQAGRTLWKVSDKKKDKIVYSLHDNLELALRSVI